MTNIQLCQQILNELASYGVREFVFCAGARNAPFISCLGQLQNAGLFSFFEERSAAFFALGRARASRQPVAVITTSGTAAAELLPACIEAFHSGVPLVLVTADRPRRMRHTGAPQSIDQTRLMTSFVEQSFDLENGTLEIGAWSLRSPLHINVCLDEPLLDSPVEEWQLKASAPQLPLAPTTLAPEILQKISAEASCARQPLVILSALEGADEMAAASHLALTLGWPVYAEATSGLREARELESLLIRSGEQFLSHIFKKYNFDFVLRLGSVPTTRLWRDLEDRRAFVKVASVSALPFSGLSDSIFLHSSVENFKNQFVVPRNPVQQEWQRQIAKLDRAQNLVSLYEKYPRAEASLVHELSKKIGANELVYVGNSLPIREWDLAADFKNRKQVFANRGVNGIDGQISSFIGLAHGQKNRSWCVVGDLTALYDLTAPWPLLTQTKQHFIFVIINNGGGKIFKRLFANPLFENNHQLNFSHWAKMWNLDYHLWTQVPPTDKLLQSSVVELVPDPEQTQAFCNELSEIVKLI